MSVFAIDDSLAFPPPHLADDNGLLAVGGDLSPQRLLLAYSCGIFPWYGADDPIMWWSPDPRCVLAPAQVHISRSLAKTIRRGEFSVTFDRCFERCMHQCAQSGYRAAEGTWISAEIITAFTTLHRLGYAHSVECWYGDELAGGLYGLALGRCFCGESMFHHRSNASKVAFAALAQHLHQRDYLLIDCQLPTAHLHSLGGYDLARRDFLARLERCAPIQKGKFVAGEF